MQEWYTGGHGGYIDGLMQERRNSSDNALELRLSSITHRHVAFVYAWHTIHIVHSRKRALWRIVR